MFRVLIKSSISQIVVIQETHIYIYISKQRPASSLNAVENRVEEEMRWAITPRRPKVSSVSCPCALSRSAWLNRPEPNRPTTPAGAFKLAASLRARSNDDRIRASIRGGFTRRVTPTDENDVKFNVESPPVRSFEWQLSSATTFGEVANMLESMTTSLLKFVFASLHQLGCIIIHLSFSFYRSLCVYTTRPRSYPSRRAFPANRRRSRPPRAVRQVASNMRIRPLPLETNPFRLPIKLSRPDLSASGTRP